MSLKKQAIKAAIWEFFGKISGNILSFGFSVVLARLLDPGEFGTIAIISGIINIASHFWDVGLGSSLIQRKEINDLHYSSVQIFNLAIGFIMFLLFFLLAPVIAEFYEKPELVDVLKVMSFLFITNSFGHVYRARIRRDLSFSLLTKSALFGVLVGGIICVIMAYYGFGIWSLVAQFLASSMVSNLFLHYFFRGQAVKLTFSLSSIKELWDYGFKMFLTGIIDVIMDNLDSLIIGKMFVSRTVGFFYRAKSLNAFVIDYSTAGIMNVYFRIASHYQDNIKALVEIYERLNSIMFFVTNYLVGILFLFNKEIIILIFTEKWIEAHYYFDFIIISSIFLPIGYLTLSTISGSGNSNVVLKLKIITKSILFLNLIVGFSFGIKGFLIGLIISNTLNFFIELSFLRTLFKIDLVKNIRSLLKILIINLILILIFKFAFSKIVIDILFLKLLFGSMCYSILYIGLSFIFKDIGLSNILVELKKIRNNN